MRILPRALLCLRFSSRTSFMVGAAADLDKIPTGLPATYNIARLNYNNSNVMGVD
jgi:hypothetical protein